MCVHVLLFTRTAQVDVTAETCLVSSGVRGEHGWNCDCHFSLDQVRPNWRLATACVGTGMRLANLLINLLAVKTVLRIWLPAESLSER